MSHRLACGCVISDALLNTLCVCGNRGRGYVDGMDLRSSAGAQSAVSDWIVCAAPNCHAAWLGFMKEPPDPRPEPGWRCALHEEAA